MLEAALYNVEDFKELPECGIEDVDRSVFELFSEVLPFYYEAEGENKKIPVVYATGERAVILKKHEPLRDQAGALILPIISIMKTGIEQDPQWGVVPTRDEIVIKKRIYSNNLEYKEYLNENNFENMDNLISKSTVDGNFSKRNFTEGKKEISLERSDRNIYETFTMPVPRFFQSTFEITFWCQFQQQMNHVYEALVSSYPNMSRDFRLESKKGYSYIAMIEAPFSQDNNFSGLGEEERMVKASINLKVNGYVINSKFPGSVPQIKRYVSSPRVSFETIFTSNVPESRRTVGIPTGDPEKVVFTDFENLNDALPGSAIGTFTKTDSTDVTIGKTNKNPSQDLIVKIKNSTTGKTETRKFVVKDANHRKGETVLREVKNLA